MDDFYRSKVANGEMAGIVILIARHGQIVHHSAIGSANLATNEPMRQETLFRLFSMTRPITSTALMMLYELGLFQLNDPVSRFIPEFLELRVLRNPDSELEDTVPVDRAPTIQDLLCHTAGFSLGLGIDPYNAQLIRANIFGREVPLAEMMHKIAKIPLRYQPGTRWEYSLSSDIQARLVEVLSGIPFEEFLNQRLFTPLGMNDTGFWLPNSQRRRLSAVHWEKDGQLVTWDDANGHPANIHFQNGDGSTLIEPWASINDVDSHKRKGGCFGLIATAEDYWRFAQMIANGGELSGTRILSPQVVDYMIKNHVASVDSTALAKCLVVKGGIGFGLGFASVEDPVTAGFINSPGSIFWDGSGTTLWWADRKEHLVVVAMTQYMGAGPNLVVLRPQVRELVYSALLN
ncbi:MAG: serine hydrolase domain-containing protein [Steroidobacteraceae bacterium]